MNREEEEKVIRYEKRWARLANEIENAQTVNIQLKMNSRILEWLEECVENGTFKSLDDAINTIVLFVWNSAEGFDVTSKNISATMPLSVEGLLEQLEVSNGIKKDSEWLPADLNNHNEESE